MNHYLYGYPTDSNGDPNVGTGSLANLEPINLSNIAGTASATENLSIDANLPADAAISDVFTTDVEVYDSLGSFHNVELSWEKTNTNEWQLSFADPTLSSDTSTTTGTSSGAVTLNYDSDGNLTSTAPSPATLSVSGWTTGATNSSIELDLGDVTQLASNSSNPQVTLNSTSHDGIEYGDLDSVSVGDDGLMTAVFDNGTSYPIYQVPLASFNNPDGLTMYSGNAYCVSGSSGDCTLVTAGAGSSGSISGSSLEGSTVDTADQMTKLIVAQQAYSASAEVVSSTDEMFDTLIRAKS